MQRASCWTKTERAIDTDLKSNIFTKQKHTPITMSIHPSAYSIKHIYLPPSSSYRPDTKQLLAVGDRVRYKFLDAREANVLPVAKIVTMKYRQST